MTKLLSALPDWPQNGLGAIANQLVADPQTRRIVIAVVDCAKTETDNDTGEEEPKVRIRQIEPITRLDDLDRVKAILRGAFAARTGRDELPFDQEDDDA